MKRRGMYVSRQLSFKTASFETDVVDLTPSQRAMCYLDMHAPARYAPHLLHVFQCCIRASSIPLLQAKSLKEALHSKVECSPSTCMCRYDNAVQFWHEMCTAFSEAKDAIHFNQKGHPQERVMSQFWVSLPQHSIVHPGTPHPGTG